MNKSVLIIGFGKMGHIYSKYFDNVGIEWTYYDPFVSGGLDKIIDINNYSHVVVSTQPEQHYGVYKKLMGFKFKGNIYIDKPVIISDKHLSIFKDGRVFCGMTERYNPAVVTLKGILDIDKIISIKFGRYSTVPNNMKAPVLFDLGVHDLDLYLYLLGFDEIPKQYSVFEKSKTCYILAKQNDILSIFEWSHESHRRMRKIVVLQKGTVYEADLIDQTVISYEAGNVRRNLYVNKAQPVEKVMEYFINNEKCNAKLSHGFMFAIMCNKLDMTF